MILQIIPIKSIESNSSDNNSSGSPLHSDKKNQFKWNFLMQLNFQLNKYFL